jgi:hypothetical protein
MPLQHLDTCPVCEKGQLKMTALPEPISGAWGSALVGKQSVPYTFTARWLACDLCGERFLTDEDDVRWNELSEKLKEEFTRINS